MKVLPLLTVICAFPAATLSAQTIIWSENFDDMTAGSVPVRTGASVLGNNNTTQKVWVVDSQMPGPYTDPFGGAENKSLLIEKTGGSDQPGVIFQLPGKMTEGKIQFDIYMYDDAPGTAYNTPMLQIYTYLGSTSNIASLVTFNNGSVAASGVRNGPWDESKGDYSDVSPSPALAGAMSKNTKYTFELIFFSNNTYSLYLDGELLKLGPNEQTVFNYRGAGIDGIDRFRFATADTGRRESIGFIDNIVVTTIPEPGDLALLGVGGLLLWGLGPKAAIASFTFTL